MVGGDPVSVSWAADPDTKRDCGHPRCRRDTRTGMTLLAASAAVIIAGGAAAPGVPSAAVVAAAFTVFAAGVTVLCRPHPRTDFRDLEALIDATRETIPDHVPDTWVKEFLP